MAGNGEVTGSSGTALYREEQRFRQWWVWVLVLGVAAVAWWGFVQQILVGRQFGDNPAPDWAVALIWVIFGLGLPLLFWSLVLIIEVMPEVVRIRLRPLTTRVIPVTEVATVEVRKYRPMREYGGWGVKGWTQNKVAYNVSGTQGVDLTLADGRRVLLGSQRPDELATVINAATGAAGRRR
jgi:hypothetical protein